MIDSESDSIADLIESTIQTRRSQNNIIYDSAAANTKNKLNVFQDRSNNQRQIDEDADHFSVDGGDVNN